MILYIPDLKLFREQAINLSSKGSKLFSFNGGMISYNVLKTPVKYRGNESISLVRGFESDLNGIDTVKNIGECIDENGEKRYIFKSNEDRLTYERVRGPVTEGHPYMIGVFA